MLYYMIILIVATDQPFQRTNSLDPEVREDLELQLEINLEAIRKRYAKFVFSLCECIVKTGVSVKSFQLYLVNLPALDCDDDDEQHKLLSEVKDRIQNSDTIHDMFMILSKECASFLNFDIFQTILDDFEIQTDKSSEALKYSEHLKAYFAGHKVSEFIEINPRLEKFTKTSTSKKLTLKFNITLPSRVTKVFDLKKTVAKIMKLRPSALRLVGIEERCVLVTFLTPSFVADFTPEQLQEFRALPVLHLRFDDQIVTFDRDLTLGNVVDGIHPTVTGKTSSQLTYTYMYCMISFTCNHKAQYGYIIMVACSFFHSKIHPQMSRHCILPSCIL